MATASNTDVTIAGGLSAAPRPLAAIFWGGLLAGLGDITQAFVGFGFYDPRDDSVI